MTTKTTNTTVGDPKTATSRSAARRSGKGILHTTRIDHLGDEGLTMSSHESRASRWGIFVSGCAVMGVGVLVLMSGKHHGEVRVDDEGSVAARLAEVQREPEIDSRVSRQVPDSEPSRSDVQQILKSESPMLRFDGGPGLASAMEVLHRAYDTLQRTPVGNIEFIGREEVMKLISDYEVVLYADTHDHPCIQRSVGRVLEKLRAHDSWLKAPCVFLEAFPIGSVVVDATSESLNSAVDGIRGHWPFPTAGYLSLLSECQLAGVRVFGINRDWRQSDSTAVPEEPAKVRTIPREQWYKGFQGWNAEAVDFMTRSLSEIRQARAIVVVGGAHVFEIASALNSRLLPPRVRCCVLIPYVKEIAWRMLNEPGSRWRSDGVRIAPDTYYMPTMEWSELVAEARLDLEKYSGARPGAADGSKR